MSKRGVKVGYKQTAEHKAAARASKEHKNAEWLKAEQKRRKEAGLYHRQRLQRTPQGRWKKSEEV